MRSFKGFSAIKTFPPLLAPPPPVKPMTFATAGSFLITASAFWMESFITGKDASCGPCMPPESVPVSCWGKKPFGIFRTMATLSAMVKKRTVSVRNA